MAKLSPSLFINTLVGLASIAVLLLLTKTIIILVPSPLLELQSFLNAIGAKPYKRRSEELNRLIPARRFGRKEQSQLAGECSVCLAEIVDGDKVRRLPACKHEYHVACIDMWLLRHDSCPLCREDVLSSAIDTCNIC